MNSYRTETILFVGIIMVVLVFTIVGALRCASVGCDKACALEGDEARYIWEAGCWCVDENGHAYNPKDAR